MELCELFILFIILKQVPAQVCNVTISVLREVPETYQFTYYEAYEGTDCLIWCTKSKRAVGVGTRLVAKVVNETVNVCCEGYIEDNTYDGDGLICVPVCNPPCNNGYCRKPNECACESGYAIDHNDVLNKCLPLCLEGCSIPDCLPTCSQYDDYDIFDTDMCFGTCMNGTCIAAGICHCNPGFRRLSEVCVPICSSCEHGTCLSPGQCKCNSGWHEECGSCQPICTGCNHGRCKAPGQCECDPGYKAENGKCVPYCSDCDNGNCITPDVCACDPGWYMDEVGTACLAHCDVACGNGSCVSPNNCECYSGYQIRAQHGDESWYNEAPRCIPVCSNCDWLCVAPDVCKCEEEYLTIYTTIDGRECDCFDCSDVSRKCEKITCQIKSAVTSVDANMEGKNGTEIFSETCKHLEEVIPVGRVDSTHSILDESVNDTTLYTLETAELRYQWIYVAIILVEMLVILLMLVIILNRWKTKKFVPQVIPNVEAAVHYTSSVTCSKLKESTEPENS